jgi:hypothetical protein
MPFDGDTFLSFVPFNILLEALPRGGERRVRFDHQAVGHESLRGE